MRTKYQNSFFRKLRDLLTLPVDLGAVLRELFTNDQGSFLELVRRNSKPQELTHRKQVQYVRSWILLMKP
jgi:hypothetical protein